jgi:transposase
MNSDTKAHSEARIYVAIELSNKAWKLAFGDGQHTRQVQIAARDQAWFWREVAKTKARFKLAEDTPVYSCYEAGRDGFWIHRMLNAGGVTNLVVDPASIEINRRARRTKTDRLDADKLLAMLLRYWAYGEKKMWSVVRVPEAEDEARRRLHRSAERMKKEKVGHICRLRALLALHGVAVKRWPATWRALKDWQGHALPEAVVREMEQEQERLDLVKKQLVEVERHRKERVKRVVGTGQGKPGPVSVSEQWTEKLSHLHGLGAETAWTLSHEFFGWRDFKNRREVGAASGLVGSPYNSGDSRHEQGISKAGNARVRHLMTELAWRWLRFQPESALSKWYQERFGSGKGRLRRIGIVALARKLLVALWKYGAHGQLPEGAVARA